MRFQPLHSRRKILLGRARRRGAFLSHQRGENKDKSGIFTGLPLFFLKVTCFARGGFGRDVVNGAVADATWELAA